MASNGRNSWTSWKLRLICTLCQLFAGGMVACIPTYCLFLTYVSPDTSPLNLRYTVGLACYFSLNLCANWIQFRWKLVFNDVSTKTEIGCKDCIQCSSWVPSGSYHCPVCNLCVWRRDHHCFFLGGCVGFSNLLNFVSFCFNACLGSAYALVLLWRFLNVEFHPLWSGHFIYYVIPYTLTRWLVGGDVTTTHFLAVMAFNAVIAAFLSTLFMFSLQVYLIYISKTSYELFHQAHFLALSPMKSWRNFERTLGSNWFVRLFVPTFTLTSRTSFAQRKSDSLNEAMKYV